jgi:hypothetical protein
MVKRAAFGTGLELLLLAAFTSVAGAPSWSGPATRLLPSGRLRITPVSSAPGPLETTPASWVAVNAPLRRVWHNSSEGWDTFDLQLRLARQSGVRVLSMVLNEWEFAEPSTDPATLASRAYALQGVRRAVAVWPEVYLMLRLALQTAGNETVAERNVSGSEITPVLCCGDYRGQAENASTVAGNWAATTARRLRASLVVLDREFPGRIVGVHFMGLHTGEWFKPPASPYGSGGTLAGEWAWDFSPSMRADFARATPACAAAIPSPKTLDTPTVGNSWLDGSSLETRCAIAWNRFMSASVARAINTLGHAVKEQSDGGCLTAAYNGYVYSLGGQPGVGHWDMASLMAGSAIDMVASPLMYGAPTRAPWGAPMVMGASDSPSIYGKMWAMESDTRTFLCASVPAACAGNNFSTTVESTVQLFRRNLGSAAVRGHASYMLDLETYGWLGQPGRLKESQALWRGIGTLLQTIDSISSGGGGDQDSSTATRGISGATTPSPLPAAQIAVFSDPTSLDIAPLAGPAGGCPWFAQNGLKANAISLSTLGAPVQHLSTEDLLSDRLDTSQIRMAVFLNPVHLAPNVVAAIRARFGGGGGGGGGRDDRGMRRQPAMLVWLGPPGLLQNISAAVDITAPAALTGFAIQCNLRVNASLAMRFTAGSGLEELPPYDPVGGCRPSPSCFVDAHSTSSGTLEEEQAAMVTATTTTVLATENVASGACTNASTGIIVPCATMVLRRDRSHADGRGTTAGVSTVWTSAIALPWAAWHHLAVAAGVHMYVETNGPSPSASVALGDSVAISTAAVSGPSATWIHITAACPGLANIYTKVCKNESRTARTVLLPSAARVTDETGRVVCKSCTQFQTERLGPGDVTMFRCTALS